MSEAPKLSQVIRLDSLLKDVLPKEASKEDADGSQQ